MAEMVVFDDNWFDAQMRERDNDRNEREFYKKFGYPEERIRMGKSEKISPRRRLELLRRWKEEVSRGF